LRESQEGGSEIMTTLVRPDAKIWGELHAGIARGATYVICVPVSASDGPPLAMRASLNDRELAHATGLRVPEDRYSYIAAHYLLARSVQAIAGAAASWRFEPDTDGGKPRLHVENQSLHASLAHTRGAVAVAITRAADVGVDIEAIVQFDDLDDVAARVLTSRERDAVLGSADPIEMFTRLWARKEALAKAFGTGMRTPFDRIDVLDPAVPLLPPELAGAIAIRDMESSSPCRLSVALRMPEIDPVSFEIPFGVLAEEAERDESCDRFDLTP
jgi:4'-phosphopantetheinyl transferase